MNNPQSTTSGYYDKDYDYGNNNLINDSVSSGRFLWIATNEGVVRINQITREQKEYKEGNGSNLPSNKVESIAVNYGNVIWIGTYGRQMAFMDETKDEWVAVPYDISLFEKGTVEKDGKILLGGNEDNWLRTNYIHFDINDTLWVGTSVGLFKLLNGDDRDKRKWSGPFNPNKDGQPFNVLLIKNAISDIEISGNYGKRGYEKPVGDIETYKLSNTISAENSDWQMI